MRLVSAHLASPTYSISVVALFASVITFSPVRACVCVSSQAPSSRPYDFPHSSPPNSLHFSCHNSCWDGPFCFALSFSHFFTLILLLSMSHVGALPRPLISLCSFTLIDCWKFDSAFFFSCWDFRELRRSEFVVQPHPAYANVNDFFSFVGTM
jgi:hypothetical protein